MPQTNDGEMDLDAEIAAEAEKIRTASGPADVIAAARRVDAGERPKASAIPESEAMRTAIVSALMDGLWQAKIAAHDSRFFKADVPLMDLMLHAAGHIQDRAAAKARAA